MKLKYSIALFNLYGMIDDMVDQGYIPANFVSDDGVSLDEIMHKAKEALEHIDE